MCIPLSDEQYLGKGLNRSVYIHPEEPSYCIKILHNQKRVSQSEDEIRYLRKVQGWRSAPTGLYPRYRGEVETTQGRGHLFDLIRDLDSGGISPNLESYLTEVKEDAALVKTLNEALEKMIQRLYKARLVARDVHEKNICVQRQSSGEIELYLIDGIGHNAFIPLLDWVGPLRKKHHEKHFSKIRAYLAEAVTEAEQTTQDSKNGRQV